MSKTMLQALEEQLLGMSEEKRSEIVKETMEKTENLKFIPNPGPQTEAYNSRADILLYGGAGGGGKSALLLGLSLTKHKRSLIMRRHYTDQGANTEEIIAMNGTRKGYSGSFPQTLRTSDGRLIEFGACANLGDEQKWMGQPHDLIGFDEGTQFLESQIRFLMGWNRIAQGVPRDQRCRVVLATNPPVSADGFWVVKMFAPWLDIHYSGVRAKPGELRWFITDIEGDDEEVSGPDAISRDGKIYHPLSRTFIPAKLDDNPFLSETNYQATLDSLPEPLRSAIRDGNFMAAREDDPWQIIPSEWANEAKLRWNPKTPENIPLCCIGVDVAQGGADKTILASRYDGWFDNLLCLPGKDTPDGRSVAGLVLQNRRDNCDIVIDMGGGYGGAALEHLEDNDIKCYGFKGAEGSVNKTKEKQLSFHNKRAEAYWRFREALDPSQDGGSRIQLPPDTELIAELTAPTFKVGRNGILVEDKEAIKKRLGRSTDKADAVVMSWFKGPKAETHSHLWYQGVGLRGGVRKTGGRPAVKLGHDSKRRRR